VALAGFYAFLALAPLTSPCHLTGFVIPEFSERKFRNDELVSGKVYAEKVNNHR